MFELVRELELAGIDSSRTNDKELDQTHVLLLPLRPQLFGGYDDDWETRVPGDDLIGWERIEECHLSPAETRRCLWDLIDLGGNFRSDRVMSFVSKWGLMGFGEVHEGDDIYAAGESDLDEWESAAMTASNLLKLLAATESESLISGSAIDDFVRNERFTCMEEFGIDPDEVSKARSDVAYPDAPSDEWITDDQVTEAIEYWRTARRTGQGLDLQRRLVSTMLLHWMESPSGNPVWDDRGRRSETAAYGVHQIAGSRLYSIFRSQRIDVFTCSICDQPFEFDESEGKRRPGRGRRRYCSDVCRAEGKRRDNLTSWHRNKSRWTRPRQAEEGSE